MKVETKKSEGFQPIDLCIKIETEEELQLLQVLFNNSTTAVEALYQIEVINDGENNKLERLMIGLYQALAAEQY